jgi:hypothetical protein
MNTPSAFAPTAPLADLDADGFGADFGDPATPCRVCGRPGEVLRYTVKGDDRGPLSGRVFVRGVACLCDRCTDGCFGV